MSPHSRSSAAQYTQYLVLTYKGKESETDYVCVYIYIYISASLGRMPESNTTL